MPETRSLSAPVAIAGAVAIGIMTAIQSRVNGVLGVTIDNGILAGFISFFVGLIILAVIAALLPGARQAIGRLRTGIRSQTVPWWMLLGGACGALTVSTQGLTAAILGVSLFTVGIVAGQSVHGLILDRIGFGPAGMVAVTMRRVLGAALALGAVAVSLSGDTLRSAPLWMLILPFIAGVGIAWQSAVNGRLAKTLQAPLVATLTSFFVGVVVLAIGAGTSILIRGEAPTSLPTTPWLYAGGALGATYILLGTVVVARIGVLMMGLGSVLGQLATSVVIDLIWPAPAGAATGQVILMIAIAAASVLVAIPWSRRATSSSSLS